MEKKKCSAYSDFEKRDFLFVYLLIALPVIQFAVFWFYVNCNSFALAFEDPLGNFTLDNFKDVFNAFSGTDKYGWNLIELLKRSLTLWTVANVIAFPIGIATTYVLFRKVCGHYVFRVCYMLPSIVGSVVWVATVKQLAEYNGPIIEFLTSMGVKLNPSVLKNGLFAHASTAFPTLLWLSFLMGICGGNVVLTGAYSRIPTELYEVGKLDGVGFWTEFFKVAIPCVWPTISTIVTFSLCTIFIADGNVFLYSNSTGKPEMATMGYYIQFLVYRISLAGQTNPPYGYPAAIGMLVTVITVPIVLIGKWLLEKVTEPVET